MDILTRKEAIQRGLVRYFTGVACKNGHVNYRYTKTCMCVQCVKGYAKKYQMEVNRNSHRAARGYVPVHVLVHPDDVKAIKEAAEFLNSQRSLT